MPVSALPSQRHLFEIPDDVTYLNCAYMSPQLRSVREVGEAAVARKSAPWRIRPDDFFNGAEETRTLFARLLGPGADADGVALIPSVSYGIGVAALNLPLSRGQRVLVLAEEFPSDIYPWRARAEEAGAELLTVARPPDADWTAAVEAALARPEARVAVVCVPACHWTDGTRVDLTRVGAATRAAGAALVVDATQSLGAVPLDMTAVRPDFLVCAAYKWLLGPYSVGFLWAAPRWREGRPLEHGWIQRAGSEDFSRLVEYRDGYQPGARRYDVGERSNFALLPPARAALEQLLAWGVPAVHATLTALTERLVAHATERGLEAAPRAARTGHMVGLTLPAGLPEDIVPRLAERGVWVSRRGRTLRVAPHLYNSDADGARLLDALEAVLRGA
jgi:selenocysteine lyase/cysteine desulfurase